MEYVLTATKTEARAGSYYDKIWRLYDLTFKLNGYGRSLDQYFASHPPPVFRGARILDAGCGTGLLTLSLLRSIRFPVSITSLDLSASSVTATRKYVGQSEGRRRDVNYMQGNVLSLPFADSSFDFVVTSGALEYMPLGDGLSELARVIAPQGHLLHLPIRPAPTSLLLEIFFRFKHHSPKEVMQQTTKRFKIVDHYRFPPMQAIGWSKTALLAQKR
ncbi:MAG TPA: class I SAM-dependent methyltransferase [Pyrinomonadaceae bacterium]|nr:class I SAM-dependent methyltransferase [Pyrinomonadaceae bacterium]